ncbi:hypothetical protein [Herbiconiux liukaitaii]|uniref:hypothetical protein n=1 Tax=Herbiconiux liukaitaii TaxID=3342799 RepID=UPI0035B79B5D
MGQGILGRRRAVGRPVEGEDPYADYLAWIADGKPTLAAADFLTGGALAMPAADDAPEDAPAVAAPPTRRGRHSGEPPRG